MLIPDQKLLELDVPSDPDWRSNANSHPLPGIDLGQLKATLYKSADCVLHIYIEADMSRLIARAEIPLNISKIRPAKLLLRWDQKEIYLRLDEQPPIQRPWQERPELPSP